MKGKNLQLRLQSKDVTQIWWRNQNLYKQAKAKRIQHHQTSFTKNAKGTSLGSTQEKKKAYRNKPKTIKKMVIGTYILVISLNVNGLNAPTKRHRLPEWVQKQDPYICYLQESHFRPTDTYRLKVRGWKKIFHANWNQKKDGVAILISDKINFKIKTVTRDKEGHYIMIKGSIQEEDITILNIYASNMGAPQYIRQMLTTIKGEIDSNTNIVGKFNTHLHQ